MMKETFLILKNPLRASVARIDRKGEKYGYTTERPFIISEDEGTPEIIKKEDIADTCGPYFSLDKFNGIFCEFKSKYNNLYYRISEGFLFSTPSMAFPIWKYEGVMMEKGAENFIETE